MKKIWFAVFAALATLLVADHSVKAQELGTTAGGLGAGSIFTAPNGQAYMMVPNDEPAVETVGYNQPEGGAMAGCVSGGCTAGCTAGGGGCDTCCPTGWCDRAYAYGGFLYLRSRDSEVAYAMPVTGPINPAAAGNIGNAPAGAVRVLDQDFQPGFFVGFGRYLDECSAIGVQYTQFESQTNDGATLPGGGPFFRSLVSIPAAAAADVDGLTVSGVHAIKYKALDVDYRNLFAYDCDYQLNWVAGVRIIEMTQNLDASFTTLGTVRNRTDIDFYGAGLRFGLEGERYARRGFMVYGKGYLNLVPGEFRADYRQDSAVAAAQTLNASWTAGRIVTMADLELGLGWTNACGNIRLSGGYMLSAWSNVVKTNDWIKAAQTSTFVSSFNDLGSTMTFDGFVARLEYRW